jgi:hypothetical protein
VEAPSPGIFLPWRLPPDGDEETCEQGGGGTNDAGAATYRRNICTCNTSSIELGVPYDLEPGNMVGPTWQGVGELIDQDPNAVWDEATQSVRNSAFGDDWLASPRVVRIALFAPGEITGSGMQAIKFNNFALMFIEEQRTMRDPIMGRFIYYVSGGDAAGVQTGSLVRTLKLVQ